VNHVLGRTSTRTRERASKTHALVQHGAAGSRHGKGGGRRGRASNKSFSPIPGRLPPSASTSSTSRRRLQNGSNGTEVELNAGVAGASASAGAGAAEVEERQLELLTSASLRIGAAKQDLEAADITARTQTQRRSEAVKSAFHIVNVGANELTSTLDTHALRRRRDLPAAAAAAVEEQGDEQEGATSKISAPPLDMAYLQPMKRKMPWSKAWFPNGGNMKSAKRWKKYAIVKKLHFYLLRRKAQEAQSAPEEKKHKNAKLTTPELKAALAQALHTDSLNNTDNRVVGQWLTLFRVHVIGTNEEESCCPELIQYGVSARNAPSLSRQKGALKKLQPRM